jgi:hypothetical protein
MNKADYQYLLKTTKQIVLDELEYTHKLLFEKLKTTGVFDSKGYEKWIQLEKQVSTLL